MKNKHRHKATVIELEHGGAAVKFSNGRVEFVVQRGFIPYVVGQSGWVNFVRSINGYEWTFTPFKNTHHKNVGGNVNALHQRD
jgi:hypothetical protein